MGVTRVDDAIKDEKQMHSDITEGHGGVCLGSGMVMSISMMMPRWLKMVR